MTPFDNNMNVLLYIRHATQEVTKHDIYYNVLDMSNSNINYTLRNLEKSGWVKSRHLRGEGKLKRYSPTNKTMDLLK